MAEYTLGKTPQPGATVVTVSADGDTYTISPTRLTARVDINTRRVYGSTSVEHVRLYRANVFEIEYMGASVPPTHQVTLTITGVSGIGAGSRTVYLMDAEVIGSARDTYRTRLVYREEVGA